MTKPLLPAPRPSIWCLAISLSACLAPLGASAAGYTFATVKVPGAITTYAIGLDARGTLLGGYQNANGFVGGFTYAGGKLRLIGVPNSAYDLPAGINKHGEIVGTFEYACPNCQNHGFIYAHGQYTTYDAPGSQNPLVQTQLNGVNDAGEIVGSVFEGSILNSTVFTLAKAGTVTQIVTNGSNFTLAINRHGVVAGTEASVSAGLVGFRTSKGVAQVLPIANTNFVTASALNSAGTVVGSYVAGTASDGFIATGRTITSLAMPGMTNTYALGINDAGAVVGSAFGSDDTKFTGFVYTAGSFVPLTVPSALSTTPRSINEAGQVAGSYVASDGTQQAFLASPAP